MGAQSLKGKQGWLSQRLSKKVLLHYTRANFAWENRHLSNCCGTCWAITSGSVLINSPVRSISQYDGDKVTVSTSTGITYKAKKVIIANPTNTYTEIKFSAPLPAAKRALVSTTKPGIYAKVILTYTKPWWREAGLVGKFTSLVGPIYFS
jgi:monoamine oxidase